ncbi:tetratricopeptide repeat protein [Streptomyces sp. WAC06614]|uniref:tetratricopeptide repeat protein n=1 Tax=Streptomyces sp. WAC06614 TaxID=2487416 RepID=UPI00163BCB7C|nr:tetratricopeptide repeat protein [Streptomyces sp. WAC06614]
MAERRLRQRATASGQAQVVQVAGDFVGSPPAQEALWALRNAPEVLVGRGEQTAELARLLAPGGSRATVITGLAGVGKSALALTAAQQALTGGRFTGGVLFVELRGYDTGDGAVSAEQALVTLLGELGVQELPPTPEGRLARYRSELAQREAAGRRVLVVADDVAEVGQVRDLVPPGGDAHRLLVTSRDRLVAADFPARVLALDELGAVPAEELVTARLRQTWAQDPRPTAEPEALSAVAQHCGGLPLALTVAAAALARDPGLGLGAYAAQLADAKLRLERLSPPDRSGLPTGVRAAFDVSYARLPPEQAQLLRLLPVHPGPCCTTEVAVALVRTGDGEPQWTAQALGAVRELLAGLAGAGLVTEQPVGSGRWGMHDLVRLYADTVEGAAGEQTVARAKFMTGLIELAGRASSRMEAGPREPGHDPFPEVSGAVGWLDAEVDTVMWAARVVDRLGLASGVLLVTDYLKIYLVRRGRFTDLAAMCGLAAAAARRMGDRDTVVAMLDVLGEILSTGGQHEEARAVREAIARVVPDDVTAETARQMGNWAEQLRKGGRYEEAEAARRKALRMAREEGDRGVEADLLEMHGAALLTQGRTDEAVRARERAVELLAGLDDDLRTADALDELALTLAQADRHEEAVETYLHALQLFREHGVQRQIAAVLRQLGDSLAFLGRRDQALAAYQECRTLYQEAHEPYLEALLAGHMAHVLFRWGRPREARPLLERAVELLRGVEEPAGQVLLGRALIQLERYQEAEALLLRVEEAYALLGDAASRAEAAELLVEARAGLRPGPWPRLRRWLRRSR